MKQLRHSALCMDIEKNYFGDGWHIAVLLGFFTLFHDLRAVVKMKINSLIMSHLSHWVTEMYI